MDALPIYAPLNKKFEYSNTLLKTSMELLHLTNQDPITYKNGLSIHDVDGGLLSNYLDIKNSNVDRQDSDGQQIKGTYEGFRSLNLTYLPEAPASLNSQFYTDENSQKRAYLFFPGQWRWRSDINTAEFEKLATSIGLKNISLVRLIYLNPPAIGGVHIDTSPLSMTNYYDSENGVSITLNLISGDGSLHFIKNKKIYNIPPEISAWHFNPSVPHSVGKVENLRVQLRVFGSMDRIKYLSLLDLSKAVY